MERKTISNKRYLVGYHSQEYRGSAYLNSPILCRKKDAWLGHGFYFWVELDYAKYWGEDFKIKKYGDPRFYDVYKGLILVDRLLNAVFDENGYNLFKKIIEEALDHFDEQGFNVDVETINRYLVDEIWPHEGIEGIIYDDKPFNNEKKNPDRKHSRIPDLYYKKRIQIVIYDLRNLAEFQVHLKKQGKQDVRLR